MIDLLSESAARMPMGWMRSLSGVSLAVPYYHIVNDGNVPHVSPLYRFRTVAEFKADVEFFLRHFEPVTLSDIVEALNGTRTWKRPSFHLTFDDGFREMYDVVAPILQKAGVPATFFLNTAYLDGGGLAHYNALSVVIDRLEARQWRLGAAARQFVDSLLGGAKSEGAALRTRLLSLGYAQKSAVRPLAEACEVDLDEYVRDTRPHLTSDQIASLIKSGFSIGGHSHDHLLYAELPLAEQLAQTRVNMEILETRFGLSPKSFAFPHTDTGVGESFFKAVFAEPSLDVSFGTAGLVPHFHPRNIERVTMEKTSAPAERILAWHFTRAIYSKMRRPLGGTRRQRDN